MLGACLLRVAAIGPPQRTPGASPLAPATCTQPWLWALLQLVPEITKGLQRAVSGDGNPRDDAMVGTAPEWPWALLPRPEVRFYSLSAELLDLPMTAETGPHGPDLPAAQRAG